MTLDVTTLKYSTYGIAVFDLLSAMLITVVAVKMLVTGFNWIGWFLLVFAIFWSSVIVVLLVGIWKRRPKLVQGWIIFSCVGIFIELFLILYGVLENATINWERMKGAMLLFVGVVVESIFVYIVYKFYKRLQKKCPKKKQRCACFKRKQAPSETEIRENSKAKQSKSKKKDEKSGKKKKLPKK